MPFLYDGASRRVKATVNSVTTVYIGNYYEQTGAGITKYYYAGGQRVSMRRSGYASDNGLFYVHADHLGSTAITANASGGKYGELRYKAFGETRYTDGTTPTTYRFTGQREEATIGLYFYGARWYDQALGRFIQADSIVPDAPDTLLAALTVNFSNPAFLEEIGRENRWRVYQQQPSLPNDETPKGLGVVQWFQEPSGRPPLNQTGSSPSPTPSSNFQARGPADPQNLNRYTYVRNNPLRYVDPMGYWTFGFGLGFNVGLGGGVSGSVMLVFDDNGNVGLALSGGGGGYAGMGGSGGIVVQGTNADVIQHLNGPVVQTGGSLSLLGSIGGEWVIQNGPTGAIQGVNFNVGAGLVVLGVPVPVEMHSMLEVTKVIVFPPVPQEREWRDSPRSL